MNYQQLKIREQQTRIPSGCGVAGVINRSGKLFSGERILTSICSMLERGNGLGSGYAGYGIYPDFKDYWCFHIMFEDDSSNDLVEDYINRYFNIVHKEPIPTNKVKTLRHIPSLYRYFLKIREEAFDGIEESISEDDYIIKATMEINKDFGGAFVFSSGKNMGIFKGVGNPDEIGEFYGIEKYNGYLWTAHNRFPTNTVAWWGGAHPFGILDWSIVHNGEISSYGINKRYLENAGYYCTLFTDTEVMAYLVDLLFRRHNLDFETIADIMAAPFWTTIEREKDLEKREFLKALRIIYSSALVNGPYAILVAKSGMLVGLNDRLKLRPLVAAEDTEGYVYLASEESSIRLICKNPGRVWMPDAGEPIIVEIAPVL